MMLKRRQKVLKGGGSSVVVLPVDWVRSQGLEVGDEVQLEYDGECVVVRPGQKDDSGEGSS
jgi:antitoxin component of MazEF toxin-antitoxin module